MGFMVGFKRKVKKQETPFWAFLYKLLKGFTTFSVPVIKPFHRFLYSEWTTRRAVWHNFWRVVYYEPMFKSMCEEVGQNFKMWYAGNGSSTLGGNLRVRLGDNVTMFDNASFTGLGVMEETPELVVGSNNYIGPLCRIIVAKNVTIGDWNLVGCSFIADNSGHPVKDVMNRLTSGGGAPSKKSIRPVTIGSYCFLGLRSKVYPGTVIGDGVVAQLGTHLSGNIPPFTLVGGNPVRIIGKLPIPDEIREKVGEERYQSYLDAHAKLDI